MKTRPDVLLVLGLLHNRHVDLNSRKSTGGDSTSDDGCVKVEFTDKQCPKPASPERNAIVHVINDMCFSCYDMFKYLMATTTAKLEISVMFGSLTF